MHVSKNDNLKVFKALFSLISIIARLKNLTFPVIYDNVEIPFSFVTLISTVNFSPPVIARDIFVRSNDNATNKSFLCNDVDLLIKKNVAVLFGDKARQLVFNLHCAGNMLVSFL